MKKKTIESDDTLINLIKDNNQEALELLFKRYYVRLCRFAFTILKDSNLSEESVSDVFLNIWVNRAKLNIITSVKAYLFKSVRNQSLNYLRKEKYIYENLETLHSENLSKQTSDNDFSRMELEEEILTILKKMPNKRKLVFTLSRIDGLKYKEIADLLNISVNTVQNHIVQAVIYLEKEISKLEL